jgi:NADH:ubiquinone oxidoreductase subunit 3 (subunit A)
MTMGPYLTIVLLLICAIGFGVGPLVLAWIWAKLYSPEKPGLYKNSTYECGLESKGEAWVQFKAEYYLYAIIFLIFDVEAIFLLPFAVAFTGLTAGACIAMLVFLFLLVEGLVWAVGKDVLRSV